MTTSTRGALLGTLALSLLTFVLAAPASAGPDSGAGGGESTDSGYGAWVVSLTGDYSASKVADVGRPPPICWWSHIDAPDPHDAEGVYEWFNGYLSDHGPSSAGGGAYVAGSARWPGAFEDAIEADAEGDGVTWYRLTFAEGMSMEEMLASGCTSSTNVMGTEIPIMYNYFDFNDTPPPPVIDARLLAEYAYNVMNLVSPTLEWNPKIARRDGAALINLPTWMWVTDPEAVARREVTASVGTVSATVVAEPGDMEIWSPAGRASCTAAQALVRYSADLDESSACTLTFSRASYETPGGFEVTATVPWTASWSTSTGLGDDFPERPITQNTDIRVAGSQAVVTEVD